MNRPKTPLEANRMVLPDRPKIPFTAEGLVDAVEIMTREIDSVERLDEFAATIREIAEAVQNRSHAADWSQPQTDYNLRSVQVERVAMYERHARQRFENAKRKAGSL